MFMTNCTRCPGVYGAGIYFSSCSLLSRGSSMAGLAMHSSTLSSLQPYIYMMKLLVR